MGRPSPNGEIVGRLDDKIPPYRLEPGQITRSARQLDGNASVPTQIMIELRFVLRVR